MDMASSLQQNMMTSLNMDQSRAIALNQKLQNRENQAELKKTAKQFEAVFFKQLITEMDKTVDRSSGILDGGSGEETFRGMLYDKMADNISQRSGGSGFGIAEAIYRQLQSKVPGGTANVAPDQKEVKP